MESKPTLLARLRYRFDNTMSAGSGALIRWLAILSLIVTALVAGIATVFEITEENESPNFVQIFWKSLMRTLDAGNLSNDEAWGARLLMLLMTVIGIFVVSILIGILTSGIEAKLEQLRKGRSFVVEKDHTLILGWSSKVFSIVSELIVANANRANAVIVILADKDKVEMEEELQLKIGDFRNTRVICRSGLAIDMDHLNIVNPNQARSIIILSPEDEFADAHVIKAILALVNNPRRKKDAYHIVAEIEDTDNVPVAQMVGKDELCLLTSDDLISRITVQTCRHSGLSVVYSELLDFDGVEIYFQNEPGLVGKSYREAVLAYEDSAIIGLRKSTGLAMLNPPPESKVESGDSVIAISEDDDTVRLSGKSDFGIRDAAIVKGSPVPRRREKTLILGWNDKAPAIITNLDDYVAGGSEVLVMANTDAHREEIDRLAKGLKNQKVLFRKGDTTDRDTLEDLDVFDFASVVILCYSDMAVQEADSLTLITLLHLRDMIDKHGKSFNIVSEMLDIRNRELATVTRVNDFIVSDKLTSLMLAQLSENRELKAVYDDLFDEEGNEIYIKPVTNYVKTGEPVNFYTVAESALRMKESAFGYRLHQHESDPSRAYGIVVNPKKSDTVTFGPDDKIIVVSED